MWTANTPKKRKKNQGRKGKGVKGKGGKGKGSKGRGGKGKRGKGTTKKSSGIMFYKSDRIPGDCGHLMTEDAPEGCFVFFFFEMWLKCIWNVYEM